MGKIVFRTEDVRKCIQNGFGGKGERTVTLRLVHDEGIYLMSFSKIKNTNCVIYAEGCDPNKDGDTWYDTSRDLVGGDDFCHSIPFTFSKLMLTYLYEELHFVLSKDKLTFTFAKPSQLESLPKKLDAYAKGVKS